jgi:hypothetical protein
MLLSTKKASAVRDASDVNCGDVDRVLSLELKVDKMQSEIREIRTNMELIQGQIEVMRVSFDELDNYVERRFKELQQHSQFDLIFKLILFLGLMISVLLFLM